jgi:D-alanyl-D-alanine carboxypeptidase/D-alanyl-D-alanine-endopeptidase (penicillin-binding protein 4)
VASDASPLNRTAGFCLALSVEAGLVCLLNVRSIYAYIAAAVLVLLPAAEQAQTIPDQVDAILSALPGNSWSALVENDSGSDSYYARDPDTSLAPASNTKLFTTAAAFGLLGTNYTFETRIYYDGALTNGAVTGNLSLVCEHDPTWNTTVFSSARTPLDHIAAQLKALGLTSVASNVQCYGVCAYNLSSTGFLNVTTTEAKNAAAAAAFMAALQARGIAVSGSAVGQPGFSTPGTQLYTHHSSDLAYQGRPLRLGIACIPLLKVSHNVMADLLCRHLGWKLGADDSYSAGTTQVLGWLSRVPSLSTNGMVMNDGSGLSRGNRFSARQCVALTRYMLAASPVWDEGLPIGCVDGTIRRRFCGTDGEKVVHAKTGSLRTSIALSGYVNNLYDDQRYLFSFIGNRTNIDQTATRQAIDNAVALFGGPFRVVPPQVSWSDSAVTFTWPASPGHSYRVQFKNTLSDPAWQPLGSDITATGMTAAGSDPGFGGAPQRFYRIWLVR